MSSNSGGSGPLDIYMIAIGGTGMAPLACLLQDLGHRVRGADNPLYPPMSTLLENAGIEPLVGYDGAHLETDPRPDLVIVGNAVPRHNPEAEAAEASGIERISMPQALSRFLLAERKPLVVAGTHGKTTTSSIAAWAYHHCGRDPGFLVGGIPINLDRSFQVGTSERFVIEGDEYNASYFDRGPKFLHYRPHTLILTSVEYDHADLYANPEDLTDAYRRLVRLVPEDGLLVAHGDSDAVRRVAEEARCKVVFYGTDARNDVHPLELEMNDDGTRCFVDDGSGGWVDLHLTVPGEHNLWNALAVWAAARHDGLPTGDMAAALGSFQGAKRRLEELDTVGGVTVVDDFAHHPTAVGKSLEGLRAKYPGRRLVAVFEPRSLTAGRSMFYLPYLRSFSKADLVRFAPVFYAERLTDDQQLDLDRLVTDLASADVDAATAAGVDRLERQILDLARDGDVVVTMSSGSFEGLPHRLVDGLKEKWTG